MTTSKAHTEHALDELAMSRSTDDLVSVAAAVRAVAHALLAQMPTPVVVTTDATNYADILKRKRDMAAASKRLPTRPGMLPPVAYNDEASPESWPLPNMRAALNRDGGEHA